MIYVSFMDNKKQSSGVLLAGYKKQPDNEGYNLVFNCETKTVVEVKNEDMILTTLNLVAEWVNVPIIDIVATTNNDNSSIGLITDYYGYPFIADDTKLFLNLSNTEYATKYVLENLPELKNY